MSAPNKQSGSKRSRRTSTRWISRAELHVGDARIDGKKFRGKAPILVRLEARQQAKLETHAGPASAAEADIADAQEISSASNGAMANEQFALRQLRILDTQHLSPRDALKTLRMLQDLLQQKKIA